MDFGSRNKISTKFSMSSMTDIIFLLLIFFLLTSSAVTPHALDLLLPKSSGKTTNVQNVAVSITNELKVYVNNKPVSFNSLESTLNSSLQGVENPTIVLRAEKSVPVDKVVRVMDIANRNKYKLILAVSPKE